MNTERNILIEKYRNGLNELNEALAKIPAEAIDFYPAPGKWNVREIVLHIADSEANSYVRCRKGIAESGSSITAYDQDSWSQRLFYADGNMEDALALIKLIRDLNYKLLINLPDEAWQTNYLHPENGITWLDGWLDVYVKHIDVHIRQMMRNLEAFNASTN